MMGQAVVFFDLDRTLLRGASGPILSAALREAGVLSRGPVPGEAAVFKLFDLIGETLPSMALTRGLAKTATGWSSSAVVEAATQAAELLAGHVQPWARQLMDEHRAAGRSVVLATTTPFDMVKPFADQLGLDDVIATRYGLDDDGAYDGSIVGNFVWGPGKLSAVRAWADERDVDLAHCWAYSDSFFDVPLLNAVGHAIAVNPDPRLTAVAAVKRWPVLHLDVPPGVPKLAGIEPMKAVRPILRPELLRVARYELDGLEHLPETGPAMVVANHRSYFDPVAIAVACAKRGRSPRFLAKREVFDAPLVGQLVRATGAIRVDRGTGAEEPLLQAARALDAGELVVVLPQGTIPRGEAFFDPELKGKHGAARLAALTGAPVVPLGLWGTERVWPRRSKLPKLLTLNPPQVRVKGGPAIEGLTGDVATDTDRIMAAITALLPPDAHIRRQPTAEEIRAASPS